MHVYLAWAEGTDNYKIGYTSKKPEERLLALQTGNSEKLVIVNQFETRHPTKLENVLHRRFVSKRGLGEWFVLDLDEVNNFTKICEKYEQNFDLISSQNTYYQDRQKK